MPLVDRRVVLNTRISAIPSALGHSVEHLSGAVLRWRLFRLVRNPSRAPNLIVTNRLHELICQANRQVRILEHHRRVGLAVEVRFVTFADQSVRFLLFFPLALDKVHHVRMPYLDRLHLGRSPGLAPGFDHRCDLVVDSHERQRTTGLATTRELLATRTDRREVRPGS